MLPARPIVFPSSRAYNQGTNQSQSNQSATSQPTQQSIPQPSQQHSSLPPPSIPHSLNPPVPYLPPPNGLGSSQMLNLSAEKPVASTSSVVPGTPQPLTLEQQHITAVDGMVPTLQFVPMNNFILLQRDSNIYICVETL